MEPHLGRFGTTISDWWSFFIPPILNAIVLLIVFPGVPNLIWDSIGYVITVVKEVAPEAGSSLPKLLEEFAANLSVVSAMSDGAISAFVSAVVTVAILIFMLHKVVLWSSRLLFGRLDLKEEKLSEHPVAGRLVEYVEIYLPEEKLYKSFHRKWEYARSVNDMQENMGIYRNRRDKITSDIARFQMYATYASAYFAISFLSVIINKSGMPLLVALLTGILFLFFARRYAQMCALLADIDFHTFLSIVQYGNELEKRKPRISNVRDEGSISMFPKYIYLGKGNIGSTVVDMFHGVKVAGSYTIRRIDRSVDLLVARLLGNQ